MFFGIPPFNYRQKLEETSKLPRIEVSEKKFIKLCIENGITKEKAEFQAKMCKGLHSHIQLGNQMVGIKQCKDLN